MLFSLGAHDDDGGGDDDDDHGNCSDSIIFLLDAKVDALFSSWNR